MPTNSLSHAIDPVLKLLVGRVDPPRELECLLPFLLGHLAELHHEPFKLVLICGEDVVAASHNLSREEKKSAPDIIAPTCELSDIETSSIITHY